MPKWIEKESLISDLTLDSNGQRLHGNAQKSVSVIRTVIDKQITMDFPQSCRGCRFLKDLFGPCDLCIRNPGYRDYHADKGMQDEK